MCFDIEKEGIKKPITIICLYKPRDGIPEVIQLVKGDNLSTDNLRQAFAVCKLLITFNGFYFDVPKIQKEFPGVIPNNFPIIDLFRFAKMCGMKASFDTMENTYGIERIDDYSKKKHIAVKLWKRYSSNSDMDALAKLLEYNKQDTINFIPSGRAAYWLRREANFSSYLGSK